MMQTSPCYFNLVRRMALMIALYLALWPVNDSLVHAAPAGQTAPVNAWTYIPVVRSGPASLCRLGANGAPRSYPVKPLRLAWYVDYQATRTAASSAGMEYFPMIRLEQNGDSYRFSIYANLRATPDAEFAAVIAAHPGAYWFIGNEPDRKQFQDGLEPQVYAEAYHDLYARIKSQDPTAQIVAGGIVQPTPLRLLYLDRVLTSYYTRYGERMPVDAWAFHNFVLNEASCAHYNDPSICWGADIPPGLDATDGLRIDVQDNDSIELFQQQVVAFRRWVASRGYRNVPVFLSEFGVLMPAGLFSPDFDAPRVNAFMDASMEYLLNAVDPEIGYPADGNRLVQRFSWYSMDYTDYNGPLFDAGMPNGQSRTAFGDNLARFAANLPDEVDLYPVSLDLLNPPPLTSRGAATITLAAVIANSGNTALPETAQVRFFQGNPAQGGKLIGKAASVALPGCGGRQTVRMDWSGVRPGSYEVYVQVDGDRQVAESDETNNVITTTVQFAGAHVLVPSIRSAFTIPE